MKLIVLMYHRASSGRYGNPSATLDSHFAHIARHYRCVMPGETLDANRLNVCLSFDDGYYDFYALVFPLLKKHGLRALLAVPVAYLQERCDRTATERLSVCENRDNAELIEGYCTWSELVTMTGSGRVVVAAHGFTHMRLDHSDRDLHAEIVVPQTLLAARLGSAIDNFVLPFGRFDRKVVALAKIHYRFVFRIGNADNAGWDSQLLYRINADEMRSAASLFGWPNQAGYRVRRHWNALRNR